MPRYFTHYWNNSTWESERNSESGALNHAAGNLFRKRGVEPSDFVYVLTVKAGQLLLGSRMQVGQIVAMQEAREILGTDDVWDAEDHIIAVAETALEMSFDRLVPVEVVRQLRFVTSDGDVSPHFAGPDILDSQTMRGVRQLTVESARMLDGLLAEGGPPSHRFEEIDLTEEDELILDRVWDRIAAEDNRGQQGFDPEAVEDERIRATASIVQRLGQPEFRRMLLQAYGGRCAVTGCDVEQALQAAHIIPYQGPTTDHCSNGLLLRADIHNLFDLHLLRIEPATFTVRIAPSLRDSIYGELEGRMLAAPPDVAIRPNCEALRRHFDACQRNWLVRPSST